MSMDIITLLFLKKKCVLFLYYHCYLLLLDDDVFLVFCTNIRNIAGNIT